MTALTFKQIQDFALADGFTETDREAAKAWIVARHTWLWGYAEWVFRDGTSSVTFTANSQTVSGLPTDFLIATAVYDSQGAKLTPVRDIDRFFDAYNTLQNLGSSRPEAYTVFAGQLLVGPLGDGSTGLLIYEKSKPLLVNDNDLTGLPDGYDLMLVYGAKASGFKLTNVPLSAALDQDFQAGLLAMQRDYLTGIRGQVGQMGAYRPGSARQWR